MNIEQLAILLEEDDEEDSPTCSAGRPDVSSLSPTNSG